MLVGTRSALLLFLLLVAVLTFSTPSLWGCSCVFDAVKYGCAGAGKGHAAVFVGRAMSEELVSIPAANGKPVRWAKKTLFSISENMGNPLPKEVAIYTHASPPPARNEHGQLVSTTTSCDFSFSVGKDYLVFADLTDDLLYTGYCSGTREADPNDWILDSFRHLPPPGTGYLKGVVEELRTDIENSSTNQKPLSGIALRIEGPVSRETRTAADGTFRLDSLPSGDYIVKPELDSQYSPAGTKIHLVDRGCVDFPIWTRLLRGRIAGRVMTSKGKPAAKTEIELLSPRCDTHPRFVGGVETDELGFFEWAEVPPGKYMLGVNTMDARASDEALYPPSYYSGTGTSNCRHAKVIEVGVGQKITGLIFTLPKPLPRQKVEQQVTVLWPDGRPVSGVWFSVHDQRWPDSAVGDWRTDQDGHATLELLQGTQYKIQAYINISGHHFSQFSSDPKTISTAGTPSPLTLVLRCDPGDCPGDTRKKSR